MTYQAEQLCKKCHTCQKFKKHQRHYGHLLPKDIGQLRPWNKVHIDLVGPYSIKAHQQQPHIEGEEPSTKEVELKLTAMTFVDPATG